MRKKNVCFIFAATFSVSTPRIDYKSALFSGCLKMLTCVK